MLCSCINVAVVWWCREPHTCTFFSLCAQLRWTCDSCSFQKRRGSYQSLHLQKVSNCTVRLLQVVHGAIHVIDCHNTSLWSTSHQLRLHDSSNLSCHVTVSAGAIVEDCTNLVFYAATTSLDVKDFNWLKSGISSPNYKIEPEATAAEKEPSVLAASEPLLQSGLPGGEADGFLDIDTNTQEVTGVVGSIEERCATESCDGDDEL